MHRYLIPVIAALILAGCANQPATTSTAITSTTPTVVPATTPAPTNPVQTLSQFSDADLANAIAVAKAAQSTNPAAVEYVNCLTWIQQQKAALTAALTPAPSGTVGAFTALTIAGLGLDTATSLTGPAQRTAFEIACGPLNAHIVNGAMTLAQQVTQIVALAPKVP
jgi:hypothetical protein